MLASLVSQYLEILRVPWKTVLHGARNRIVAYPGIFFKCKYLRFEYQLKNDYINIICQINYYNKFRLNMRVMMFNIRECLLPNRLLVTVT